MTDGGHLLLDISEFQRVPKDLKVLDLTSIKPDVQLLRPDRLSKLGSKSVLATAGEPAYLTNIIDLQRDAGMAPLGGQRYGGQVDSGWRTGNGPTYDTSTAGLPSAPPCPETERDQSTSTAAAGGDDEATRERAGRRFRDQPGTDRCGGSMGTFAVDGDGIADSLVTGHLGGASTNDGNAERAADSDLHRDTKRDAEPVFKRAADTSASPIGDGDRGGLCDKTEKLAGSEAVGHKGHTESGADRHEC